MKKITKEEIFSLAQEFSIAVASILSILEVESGGKGFDETTGKVIIQFEPAWFKRKAPYTPSGLWSLNRVERQAAEWKAFNDAFSKNPNAAMESTSVGLMQVMGFHWKLLGFKSVGELWDYAKASEYNQLRLGLLFILKNKKMFLALQSNNFEMFAYYYNGENYKKYNYHNRMREAFKKHQNQ